MSLLYQPVEIDGDHVDALAAGALLRYEDTIMIEVRAGYYQNATAKRFRLGRPHNCQGCVVMRCPSGRTSMRTCGLWG